MHSGQYVLSPLASRDVINFVRSIPTVYSVLRETGGAALSPREEAVVKMLTQGMSNAEMSRALFVSESTVKAHLSSVIVSMERQGQDPGCHPGAGVRHGCRPRTLAG